MNAQHKEEFQFESQETQPAVFHVLPQVIRDDKTENLLIRAKLLADSRKYLDQPVTMKELLK